MNGSHARSTPTTASSSRGLPQRASPRDQWLAVELRHIAALAAVAQQGSFSAAAEELGYVQSAVSQQISYLERAVGAPLVRRGQATQGLTLTVTGSVVLRHAETILAQLRAAKSGLHALIVEQCLTVRVGVEPIFSGWLQMHVLPDFLRSDSGVAVAVVEGDRREVFESIDDGALDLGFASLPLEPGPFSYDALAVSPNVLVVERGSKFDVARLGTSTLADLEAVGLRTGQASTALEDYLTNRGADLRMILRSSVAATLQNLVHAGLDAAILPQIAVDQEDDRISCILLPDLPPHSLAMIWRSDRRMAPPLEALRSAGRAASVSMTTGDGGRRESRLCSPRRARP